MSFDELYQSILMDHYRNPRNAGPLSGATCSVHDHNPLCGDDITVHMKITGGNIAHLSFEGKGCAISIASASMMTEQLTGKTVATARTEIDDFLAVMRGESEFSSHPEFEELASLEGVRKLHARVKCATLAWNAAKKMLSEVDG